MTYMMDTTENERKATFEDFFNDTYTHIHIQ